MIYVSTRNHLETYTAHRALHEEFAPDGGYYVPFYLPSFSPEALSYFKKTSAYDTVAEILNLFFSLRLNADDIENAIGKPSFSCKAMSQNFAVLELWHTPESNSDYIFKKLNHLLSGRMEYPVGWARVAIEISLLFGVFGIVSEQIKSYDMSVVAGDLSEITAVIFAKAMGFPVNRIICACDDDSVLWELVKKGECGRVNTPAFTELLLYKLVGGETVIEYVASKDNKKTYYLHEVKLQSIHECIYPAVVSADRAGSIICGMYSSNQYMLDNSAALAYGSLQDYRSIVGINNPTLILAHKRP